jgi:hypothetical protein
MERTREEQIAIANEIIRQLGGRKFTVMTGAKDYMATGTGLRFRLPGGGGFTKNGINLVIINLDPSDTYSVEFSKVQKRKGAYDVRRISTHTDIYNDSLQRLFTAETGLDTHL